MNKFFQKNVNRSSRKAMANFLQSHFRYDTMRSWNGLTSYANNIKIHHLGLSRQQFDKALEILDTDFWDEINGPISDFTHDQGYRHTICTNGSSGGYLVLHGCHAEKTGHLSYCPSCGQQNYKKVPPIFTEGSFEAVIAHEILNSNRFWRPQAFLGQPAIQLLSLSDDEKMCLIPRLIQELKDCSLTNACGRCKKARLNYSASPTRLVISNRSIDFDDDFDKCSMNVLRDHVELVCAFDATCDAIRSNFIALIKYYDVLEFTEYRPFRVKKLLAHAA